MNPRITPESLEKLFSSQEYWFGETCYADYGRLRRVGARTADLRLRRLAQFLPPGASVLEVGSAGGEFLERCLAAGYSTTGIEVSSVQAEALAGRFTGSGVRVVYGSLEDVGPTLETGSFDAVCLWGIEGNFAEPLEVFVLLNHLLRPGGICALNWMHFRNPLRSLLFGNFRMGPTALSNFSPKSFAELVRRTGFEMLWQCADLQYASPEKYCSLSGRWRLLRLLRSLGIASWAIPVPTILGRFAVLRKTGPAAVPSGAPAPDRHGEPEGR